MVKLCVTGVYKGVEQRKVCSFDAVNKIKTNSKNDGAFHSIQGDHVKNIFYFYNKIYNILLLFSIAATRIKEINF